MVQRCFGSQETVLVLGLSLAAAAGNPLGQQGASRAQCFPPRSCWDSCGAALPMDLVGIRRFCFSWQPVSELAHLPLLVDV